MKVTVSGKQVEIGDAFPAYAESHLDAVVEKYFDSGIDSNVTVSRAGSGLRIDISVHPGRGIVVQSHGEGATAHAAFDLALERIAKRLRRYKRRLRDHHRKERSEAKQNPRNAQQYVIAPPADEEEADQDSGQDSGLTELGDNPVIIAETTAELETLSVSEAVMRLDLSDRSAMVFLNAGNGRVNVVYLRRDGNIGWIDPETDEALA
jgi:ribosomal subunit interface protein